MKFVGIDPSSKTGFVVLDESDLILRVEELTGGMRTIHDVPFKYHRPI